MSKPFLVTDALDKVWCNPNPDMQTIIQPARITPQGGVWNKVDLPWRTIKLPEQGPKFHIFQVGQLNPMLIGLLPATETWVTLAATCIANNFVADVYANSGVEMPRTQVWYRTTVDSNLIFAVKQQPTIPINFDTDPLYIRFYTNLFFQTPLATPSNFINVQGGPMTTTSQIVQLQNQFNAASQLAGGVYAFVNGMFVNNISLQTVSVGDVAEFVYDSSIFRVETFTVGSLLSYDSTLDSKAKFLLHYPTYDESDGIEYFGDIDFFVTLPGSNGSFSGVYYHKNQPDAVRMLTHKDYGLPVPYVEGYAATQPTWTDTSLLVIRMYVRHSGFSRDLVYENSRIEELYKMADANVAGAMLGVNATVSVWQAANLEAANYPLIMRSAYQNVTQQMVQDAYGYNAISVLVGYTPLPTVFESNLQVVEEVPPGLMVGSTAYEYNANGHLIGYYPHNNGESYVCTNNTAKLVEMIVGTGGQSLDETYGATTVTLDPTLDYRMYTSPISNGTPTGVWTDVTGGPQYGVVNNVLTWLIDPTEFYTLVRSNKQFLAYGISIQPTDGLLKFSLDVTETRGGSTGTRVMEIPMGELDVFLNGRSLIETLDYYVVFPEIVIVNKEYLINPKTQAQRIDIRFTGFCNSDLTRTLSTESGFIIYGLVSNNNTFNLRDDKVMRVVINGAVYDKNTLLFAENTSAITGVPDEANGKPYLLRDIVVPMRGVTVSDTYTLRAASQVIDTAVSDYLTLKLPTQNPTTPSGSPTLYVVYSPFCCKIIYDLLSGALNNPLIMGNYSDQDVANICQPYLYLLNFDPTKPSLRPDPKYVTIQPHNLATPIAVSIYYYKFIARVVKIYLNNAFSLSQYLSLTPS